jgi:transposase-like protein
MDTLHLPEAGRRRRRYTPEFKAQLLAACQQPGISITAIALANQINPNVVRRWLRDLRSTQTASVETELACIEAISSQPVARPSNLVPLEVMAPQSCRVNGSQAVRADDEREPPLASILPISSSTSSPAEPIQVELCRGETLLKVAWPAAHAEVCALWLRGLLQ